MFGDYEAQRHWQEVTYNLPVQEWSVWSFFSLGVKLGSAMQARLDLRKECLFLSQTPYVFTRILGEYMIQKTVAVLWF